VLEATHDIIEVCAMERGTAESGVETAPASAPQTTSSQYAPPGYWHVVDRALRTIAQRRAGLDAEEARWLREAEALEIWRPLGMVSALDYMERVLGYAPRTAQDRLRVARALGALPRLTAALASGALVFSAVRELTRVATHATEAAWLAEAQGKNLREIEDLVADHRLGDRPEDPKDPTARTHIVRLELSAETFALLRQARQVLDDEHGTSLSEDQLVAQLCGAVLDGSSCEAPTGRAKFQVAVTVCERCQQGWQHGAGAKIPIAAAAVERALCDAQHIGSIDGETPERAHQDVSPSVARFVWHRDGGRCRVPGCRSSRGLEIHHIVHRADGGGHDALGLVLLCSSCHLAHHAGTLAITGTADRLEVIRPAQASPEPASSRVGTCDARVGLGAPSAAVTAEVANTGAHVGAGAGQGRCGHPSATSTEEPTNRADHPRATRLDVAELCAEAKVALKQMGWKPATAQAAVRAAASMLGEHATLERVLFEALRQCPRPSATAAPTAEARLIVR
jgi:hypothetical protein